MTWYETFDAVFWTGISTALLGSFALAIKYALRSKCDDLNLCWGLVKIHRRVELESTDNLSDEEKNSPKANGQKPNIEIQRI